MLTEVHDSGSSNDNAGASRSLLDEVVRDGARKMLAAALAAEVAAYVEQFAENGHRLVVCDGYHDERSVLTAAGAVLVTAPRVNDNWVDVAVSQDTCAALHHHRSSLMVPRLVGSMCQIQLPKVGRSKARAPRGAIAKIETNVHDILVTPLRSFVFPLLLCANSVAWRGGPGRVTLLDSPMYLCLQSRAARWSCLPAVTVEAAERVWVRCCWASAGADRCCSHNTGAENDSSADQRFGDQIRD
jgi:hypothetical protein